MFKIIKGVNPGIILLNIFILLVLWISPLIFYQQQSFCFDNRPMPLYLILRNVAGTGQSGIITALALILFVSYLLVHFNTVLFFIPERTSLPSVLYAFFTGYLINYQTLNPVIPASIFILLAFGRVIDAYHKNGTAFSFFDASLLTGIGTLFYANLIWFCVILVIGVIILRGYKVKEIILSIAGIPLPLLITAGIYYIFSLDINRLIEDLGINLFEKCETYKFSTAELAVMAVGCAALLTGIIFVFQRIKNMKIRSRKIFILLLWWCLLCIALYFISPAVSAEIFYLAAIPSVYFITYYFIFSKSRVIPLVLFIDFIICSGAIQILQYLL